MDTSGGNTVLIKKINAGLVRAALRREGRATKQQLAAATGLSQMTVGTILRGLVDSGEAREDELVASNGGRPARQYCYNAAFAHALLLFMHEEKGRDAAHLRVVDLFGDSVHQEEYLLDEIGPDSFDALIRPQLSRFPTVRALGLGLPAFVRDNAVQLCDYPALTGYPLAEDYSGRFGFPVLLENDVNAAAMGFFRRNRFDAGSSLVYIYFPRKYPPGAGICLGGGLYRGFTGYAGEIGGLPVGEDWRDDSLYRDFGRFCVAVERLVTGIAGVLNPRYVALHGTFLTEEHRVAIARLCADSLPPPARPELLLSSDFTLDYQTGMAEQTLALLEPSLPQSY